MSKIDRQHLSAHLLWVIAAGAILTGFAVSGNPETSIGSLHFQPRERFLAPLDTLSPVMVHQSAE